MAAQDLERAFELTRLTDALWSALADPNYESANGIFGGWTAAVALGDDDLLSEAFGTRGADSTSEEHLRLWSRQGALLATSEQMAWYR